MRQGEDNTSDKEGETPREDFKFPYWANTCVECGKEYCCCPTCRDSEFTCSDTCWLEWSLKNTQMERKWRSGGDMTSRKAQ